MYFNSPQHIADRQRTAQRRARIQEEQELILDAYSATRRETASPLLTDNQRTAAEVLHGEWRFIVHSADGLNL